MLRDLFLGVSEGCVGTHGEEGLRDPVVLPANCDVGRPGRMEGLSVDIRVADLDF
jgi:hypothetical protein